MAEFDFSDLAKPKQKKELDFSDLTNPVQKKETNNVISGLPSWLQGFIKMFPDMLNSNLSNRAVGMGEGVKDIYRGIKQAGLGGAENLGLIDEGSQEKYTQDVNKQKNIYKNTPASKDLYANFLQDQITD